MHRSSLLFFLLISVGLAPAQTPAPKDVDIVAPDGMKLRGTLFAAAKPGPGVLLLHMCNTVRKSWELVAKELSLRGVNALTLDNRGFGESGGPRFEGGTPEVLKGLAEKWPGDFDAAYQFLLAQSGVDKTRIAAGGGSCGVDNAVKLAERHRDLKALVLLAGSTDLAGIDFLAREAEFPIFTAGAADDQYNPATLQVMRWFSGLSGNPGNRFEGYPDGRHGTEIFGRHPELAHHIAMFFEETLVMSPPIATVAETRKKSAVSEFWKVANEPGGGVRAAQMFHEARKRDPSVFLFPELAVNLLGYGRLQAGANEDAIELFKLNAEVFPASANAQDSLSDGYLAAGQKELALAAEENCLALLPGDTSAAEFKAQLRQHAEEKVASLKSGRN